MKKIITILLIIGATLSYANQNDRGGKGPKGGTPPQEAISACESKSSGDTCSVQTPRGDQLSGTCENTPDGKYFACKPSNMKPRM